MAITAPPQRPSETPRDTFASSRWPGRVARYATTPLLVGLACLALYLYIGGRELDSIEQRTVNAEYITTRLVEHLKLTAVSTFFVIIIAIPLGIVLTRPFGRRITPLFLALANMGQSVPSIGVLVLLALIYTIGFRVAVIALVIYAILPVLRNTMVGLQQVNRSIIEAGRGMGMTKLGVLLRLELPLAVPVILAGVRTALIINVGTATLATFIDAGGLGDIINSGIVNNRDPVLITGSVLTAALALLVDWLAGITEDVLRPRGL